MMNGPEHYAEAESALEAAWDRDTDDSRRLLLIANAQVHATLALAAATIDVGMTYDGSIRNEDAWREVNPR